MKNTPSSRQQINTELAIRSTNKRVKRVIAEHTPKEEQHGLKIDFYCECSDAKCKDKIAMTLEAFEELHSNHSAFVIAKGHNTPAVEQVVKTKNNLQVVEKYAL